MHHGARETLVQQWFRRVWNEGDGHAIDELMAPDCLLHGVGLVPMRGPTDFRPVWEAFVGAFTDIRFEIVQELHDGDRAAAYCDVSMVSKADGQTHRFAGCLIARFDERQVVEAWNVWDFLTLAQSRGVAAVDALEAACASR